MSTSSLRLSCLAATLALTSACSTGIVSGDTDGTDQALGNPTSITYQDGVSPAASYSSTTDTYLEQATSGTIRGGSDIVAADHDWPNGSHKHTTALVRFGLPGIPTGSKVTGVKLTLNVVNSTTSTGFKLYEVKKSWSEYQANWGLATGTSTWDKDGATGSKDVGSTALGTVNPTKNGPDTTTLNAAGIAVVQKWVNDGSTNFGFALEPGNNNNAVEFTASDSRHPKLRPQLTIEYQPALGSGSGLLGEYYAGSFGDLQMDRHDADIDFDWGKDAPAFGMPKDGFSVRWTGSVKPRFTETYTFSTVSDDGIRLWVNGQEIINDWNSHPSKANTGTIALEANKTYDIRVDYFDKTSTAKVSLSWQSPSQTKEVVPKSRLWPATPKGVGDSPIKYVVVMVKENHTFDNYFMNFPGADTSTTAQVGGRTIKRPKMKNGEMSRGLCHAHSCATHAYAGGKMNGLDKVDGALSGAHGEDDLALGYYGEDQLPNYWKYARNFVLADHFFSTTFGPSFPGHFATAAGFNRALENPACTCGDTCTVNAMSSTSACHQIKEVPCWNEPSVVNELPTGYDWAEYGWSALNHLKSIHVNPDADSHFRANSRLLDDLKAGKNPNLTIAHLIGGTSEHPPQDVCPGENQSVQLINAIMNGPHWKETAILLLWDDWGGWYDSVSSGAPQCTNGDYVRPGFRLPLMIISPYAKKGYVLKTPTEQASIIKLVEDLWGMNRLGGGHPSILDDTAGSLLGAFDFSQAPRSPMPLSTRTCN